jgi:hypothetical protein
MISSKMGVRMVLVVGSLVTLGAATGVAADRVAQRHDIDVTSMVMRHLGHGASASITELQHDPMKVIESRIQLTDEQRADIQAILDVRQGEIDKVWSEANQKLLETVMSVCDEIAAAMTPEQAEEFRALIEEMHGGNLAEHLARMQEMGGIPSHGAGHVPPAGGHHP